MLVCRDAAAEIEFCKAAFEAVEVTRRPGQDGTVINVGIVASIHLHPAESGGLFQEVGEIWVEAGKGIVGNPRYFDRQRRDGSISRRQVSLIAREQIAGHAAALGLPEGSIAPGMVRANLETSGVDLLEFVGRNLEVGEAVLFLYEPRKPCHKMDLVAPGLQRLMSNGRQGVMAEVRRGGRIRAGDAVRENVQ